MTGGSGRVPKDPKAIISRQLTRRHPCLSSHLAGPAPHTRRLVLCGAPPIHVGVEGRSIPLRAAWGWAFFIVGVALVDVTGLVIYFSVALVVLRGTLL